MRRDLFSEPQVDSNSFEDELSIYLDKKVKADTLAKEVKELGNNIKTKMLEMGEDKISHNGYNITCSERETVKTNEEQLIQVLKNNGVAAIKTVEIVDSEALEDLIYKGLVSRDILLQIQACNTITKTNVLTVRKGKK